MPNESTLNDLPNLADPDTYRSGPPLDLFQRLRDHDPVAWNPAAEFPGFWAVTRHETVFRVLRDPDTFSSALGVLLFALPEMTDPDFPRMMIEMDAPKHTRYRRLVNRGFTPRMVARLEELMMRVATKSIDRALELGSFDFVKTVASDLPAQVIAEMLGVPKSDYEYVANLSDRVAGMDEPEYGNSGGPALEAQMEMFGYASKLGALKRQEMEQGTAPGGIIEALLEAEVDGDRLSEMDFDFFILLLATAGNETTRTAITQGMRAFIEHPDQWDRLRNDPSVADTFADEVIRYATPFYYFRRTATREVELDGRTIRAGDHVVPFLVSANFDERAFTNPRAFDVGRSPNDHLAFGSGPHHCLGANLARLEISVMFRELVTRVSRVELVGDIEFLRSNLINGIKRMPVRLA